jgi:hypothetical protein
MFNSFDDDNLQKKSCTCNIGKKNDKKRNIFHRKRKMMKKKKFQRFIDPNKIHFYVVFYCQFALKKISQTVKKKC